MLTGVLLPPAGQRFSFLTDFLYFAHSSANTHGFIKQHSSQTSDDITARLRVSHSSRQTKRHFSVIDVLVERFVKKKQP